MKTDHKFTQKNQLTPSQKFQTNTKTFCVWSRFGPVQLFAAPWTVAHQAPLSMGFPRQEYWSGMPFPSPGDLPNPGIKPTSPALASGFFTTSATWEAPFTQNVSEELLVKIPLTIRSVKHTFARLLHRINLREIVILKLQPLAIQKSYEISRTKYRQLLWF